MTIETGQARRGPGRPADADVAGRTEALLEASAHVFLKHGFSQASYEMIAREAGVSTKTIYAWFGGKAGLFAAVMERFASRIEPRLRDVLEEDCAHPERALEQAGRIIVTFELEPELVDVHRAVIAAARDLPDIGSAFYALGPGKGVQMLSAFLSRCHADELLHVEDPTISAEAFIALISRGVLGRRLLRAEHGALTPEELDRQIKPALAMFMAAHRRATA